MILFLGETLRLKCDVYADPPPSFEWTRRKYTADSIEVIPKQVEQELVISDIRVKDAAYYGCIVKNRAGNISVAAVFVDINSKEDC